MTEKHLFMTKLANNTLVSISRSLMMNGYYDLDDFDKAVVLRTIAENLIRQSTELSRSKS